MKERIGYIKMYPSDARRFYGSTRGESGIYGVYSEDGRFGVERIVGVTTERGFGEYKEIKFSLGERYLGDRDFFKGVDYYAVLKFIFDMVGKSEEEVREAMFERKDKREERKKVGDEQKSDWEQLKERFGGIVIGLDKKIDSYDDGFSVRVLLRSGTTYKERKEFVHEKKKDMLRWIMEELKDNKKVVDIRFYKPVEICVLRVPEVDVKFELKKVGEKDGL